MLRITQLNMHSELTSQILRECVPELLLFKNVTNACEIKERIINSRFPCAVINPKYVLDSFQLLIATQLAVNAYCNQLLKTHSLFSEIVYSMSPNRKISDSLKRFGLNEEDTTFFCVVLNKLDVDFVCSVVKGELVDLTKKDWPCNENEIRKLFKIKDEELYVSSILDAVINRMSTKDMVNS